MKVQDLSGGQSSAFVWQDKAASTLDLFIDVCFFSLLDLCIMNSSSYIVTPVKTPPEQSSFSQLAAFAQKLRGSGPPLGRAVQEESTNMTISLSCKESGRIRDPGKFDFGVIMEGVAAGQMTYRLGKQHICCFGHESSHHWRFRLQKCH